MPFAQHEMNLNVFIILWSQSEKYKYHVIYVKSKNYIGEPIYIENMVIKGRSRDTFVSSGR